MAEFKCVCDSVAPCSASEHSVNVSVLIGVEDTNIQLAIILMKLKWTDYKWSSIHVCKCMFLSMCTHVHAFALVDICACMVVCTFVLMFVYNECMCRRVCL